MLLEHSLVVAAACIVALVVETVVLFVLRYYCGSGRGLLRICSFDEETGDVNAVRGASQEGC